MGDDVDIAEKIDLTINLQNPETLSSLWRDLSRSIAFTDSSRTQIETCVKAAIMGRS